MDSYTENDIKKGQTVPDLFVMVPPCFLLLSFIRHYIFGVTTFM